MRFLLTLLIGLFCATTTFANEVWVIAIDPGHGGKDPGAIGKRLRVYEKNVTLSIAKELKALLDNDSRFKGVLTRRGDYFIPVPERSEIARKAKANYLVSIHADSATNTHARGASVWVLSTRRANSEMGQWLEDHEKRSELLGGSGDVLSSHNELYLNKTVLDLQFVHSQQVGYELGQIVLKHFRKIAQLSRNTPQHASLGVLRSPDIPSILVETGFVSNRFEEQQLNSSAYRKQVANMIYKSLVDYYKKQMALRPKNYANDDLSVGDTYKVKQGDTLGKIAQKFGTTVKNIQRLNNLSSTQVNLGQKLKIPQSTSTQREDPFSVLDEDDFASSYDEAKNERKNNVTGKRSAKSSASKSKNTNKKTNKTNKTSKTSTKPKYYIVKKGDKFSEVCERFNISGAKLRKLNPQIKSNKILVGQRLRIQ